MSDGKNLHVLFTSKENTSMWEKRKEPNDAPGISSVPGNPAESSSKISESVGPNTAVIGKGMTIKGRIQSKQDMYVDGDVQGTLEVQGCRLTIGPHGKAEAGAKAREIEVLGVIQGNVEASEKIAIRKGGRLNGDIRAAGIVIDDGAYFKGSIDIVKKESVPAATSKAGTAA